MEQTMVEVLEAKAEQREKPKLISCPKVECGYPNTKDRLTCKECGTRLFPNHRSSEEKAMKKKDKKLLVKRTDKKLAEKKATDQKHFTKDEVKKIKGKAKKGEKTGTDRPEKKAKTVKATGEYPVKGSVREKFLNVIKKHPEGITMGEIAKEMGIVYTVGSYRKEMEERKLIKAEKKNGKTAYFPV